MTQNGESLKLSLADLARRWRISSRNTGTYADDVATTTASDTYTLYDDNDPYYTIDVYISGTNHPNLSDHIDGYRDYTLNATGGDRTSGTHTIASLSFAWDQYDVSNHATSDSGFDGTSSFLETGGDTRNESHHATGSSSHSDGTFLKQSDSIYTLTYSYASSGYVGTTGNSGSGHEYESISDHLNSTNLTSVHTESGTPTISGTYTNTEDSVITDDYGDLLGLDAFEVPPVPGVSDPLFSTLEERIANGIGYGPKIIYHGGIEIDDSPSTSFTVVSYLKDTETSETWTYQPPNVIGYRRQLPPPPHTPGGTGGGGSSPSLPPSMDVRTNAELYKGFTQEKNAQLGNFWDGDPPADPGVETQRKGTNTQAQSSRTQQKVSTPQPGGYWGGGWNPANWHRALYTGDPNAPDEYYQAAMHSDEGAGHSALENSKKIEKVAEFTEQIDPTDTSRVIKAGMMGVQARDQEALAELKGIAVDKLKGAAIAKGLQTAGKAAKVVSNKVKQTKALSSNTGKIAAEAGDAAKAVEAAADVEKNATKATEVAGRSCFPAGTLVAAFDGLRPIESIAEGECVWAYDLIASEWTLRRVMRTYSRNCEGYAATVTVAGEMIDSTSRHPYFVVRGEDLEGRPRLPHLATVPDGATTPGRWVDAGDLLVGDELLLRDGRIEPIEHRRLYPFFETVYNFEVDDLHCYAVGRAGVLVHNNNGAERSVPNNNVGRKGAFNNAKRDAGIPRSQQPDSVTRPPMTDRNGKAILDANGQPIHTREYNYTRPDGSKVVIQDHSAGHSFGESGVGDHGPHFNVRPPENTRTGKVPGTQPHYPFER